MPVVVQTAAPAASPVRRWSRSPGGCAGLYGPAYAGLSPSSLVAPTPAAAPGPCGPRLG